MVPDQHELASPGSEQVETFHNKVSFRRFLRRMTPLLVITFVFVTVVFAFCFGYFLPGVLTWVVSAIASAGVCAVVVALKKRQFDRTWRSATLQLSPWGAVLDERHLRIEMPWQAVREIGAADLMAPVRVPVSAKPATIAVQRGIDASLRQPGVGLIGAGRMTLRPGAPAMLRKQVAQNQQGRAVDPVSGQPLHAILLAQYDPQWPDGRIGAWIRAYRPDLLS